MGNRTFGRFAKSSGTHEMAFLAFKWASDHYVGGNFQMESWFNSYNFQF